MLPYIPPRDLGSQLERRRVARRAARPAILKLSRPVVSFTFDVFPKSAARTGAALIENVGGRGTFYASAAFANEETHAGRIFDNEDLIRLIAAGHEVGCHTFSQLDCARTPVDVVFSDMVRNADVLAAMGMDTRLISFAWPYGETSHAMKAQLPSRFVTARGAAPGLASGAADLAQLRANAMYGPHALRRCLAVLEQARRRNGWVIFFTRDVSARPGPWGTPTGLLERLCGSAYAGGMQILPVREAAALAMAQDAS